MKNANIFIITVPTPIDKKNKPDLSLVKKAAITVGEIINKGAIVVLESTVYPGVTEDFMIPIIESKSKLLHKKDFFVGYSPERINPGETKYKLSNIKKVVGADRRSTLDKISKVYAKIIKAGIHKVSSIRVAEASKAIENAQRDINIAFVNEVMMLCNTLNINSNEVLEAASTKWNFLKFKPGLVGGHCIGVDPYYLAEAGRKVNYKTEIILAGRKINNSVPTFILKTIKKQLKKNSKILLLGLSFKENVGDIRNSKSADLAKQININNYKLDCFDPRVSKSDLNKEYNLSLDKPKGKYDCIIVTVAHNEFVKMRKDTIMNLIKKDGIIIDIKGIWKKKGFLKKFNYWCL